MTREIERNTALALEFLEDFQSGGIQVARRHLADTYSWWTTRSGQIDDKIAKVDAALQEHLKGPMKITAHSVTAQDDRVAVEAECYAELRDGTIYNNQYHFLFRIQDGKIASVREYNNSLHAAQVWEGRIK